MQCWYPSTPGKNGRWWWQYWRDPRNLVSLTHNTLGKHVHPMGIPWDMFIDGTLDCTRKLWSVLGLRPELLTSYAAHWSASGGTGVPEENKNSLSPRNSQLGIRWGGGAKACESQTDIPGLMPKNECFADLHLLPIASYLHSVEFYILYIATWKMLES